MSAVLRWSSRARDLTSFPETSANFAFDSAELLELCKMTPTEFDMVMRTLHLMSLQLKWYSVKKRDTFEKSLLYWVYSSGWLLVHQTDLKHQSTDTTLGHFGRFFPSCIVFFLVARRGGSSIFTYVILTVRLGKRNKFRWLEVFVELQFCWLQFHWLCNFVDWQFRWLPKGSNQRHPMPSA